VGREPDVASAVGLAEVDETPETRKPPGLGLPDRACGGGQLSSAGIAGLLLLGHLAHAVLDDRSGEKVFHGHGGLLVWDRVG
jgi:hypothetical protein